MSEAEESYALLLKAAERLEANAGRPSTPMADVMEELGITDAELDAAEDESLHRPVTAGCADARYVV
ncbi:hypothetical protein [Adlercreutzia sp. ZJ473]|uniref:hypothetical protein n=1 Tax=Adlercreutzia sp. ZJ473 TaxID=2722822 RepID=UPI001554BFDA|nr:hypothetical protein [Adlercreutzia sp. ZJ473]